MLRSVLATAPWGVILFLLIPLALGVVLGVALSFTIPPISKRRNVQRAKESGARWVGLASISSLDADQPRVVQEALSGLGALYGERFALSRPRRYVGGLLWVFADEVVWEPRIWLGHGTAQSWKLTREEIRSVEVKKRPLPATNSYAATLQTVDGEVTMVCVDPKGLEDSIRKMIH